MSAPSLMRLTRLARIAAAMLTLSLAAHVAGHGALPGPRTAVLGLVVCMAGARLLAATERSLLSYLVGLAVGQLLLHLIFMASAPMPARGGSTAMLTAHGVAVALTAWWLRHADAAAARTLAVLARRVWRRLTIGRVVVRRLPWRVVAAAAPLLQPLPLSMQRTVLRRGPPQWSATLAA